MLLSVHVRLSKSSLTYDYDPRFRGIAIDYEGNAFVSHGRCLSMFDHRGNKIHEVGNLKDAYGIALDPRDGSVYVADYGASSVLKYSVA